ncbi:tRNA(His) guanylyltransferase [Quillaja saponaria]|uniref:tRNA(His) guanylyltransferase n=1 Tax=Quillaja saponaria TaxID=32244 RepID=A0AAD7KUY9_QUISA|nr:tRNA(His) guanylyltransferase [Quillaja saponaria]
MANSKYEYVKSFEVEDEVMFPNLIVVRIDGRHFRRFSEVHEFVKPNDEKALNLMNFCAMVMLEEYPDIVFAYGFSDEFSFVFKKTSKIYQRRASKVLSIIVSFFTSLYISKWREFFPRRDLKYCPSFHAQVISCASIEVLQAYLLWRQNVCHINNQYDECYWRLVKRGMTGMEAQAYLAAEKRDKNDVLFDEFSFNYNILEDIFRQGSCVFKAEVEDIVKYNEEGPVKRLRRKTKIVHSKKIASKSFWKEHPILLKELGSFVEEIDKVKPEYYIRSFEFENKLMPSTWIIIRIDGCHFHRFSELHEFEKPNDERALNLMNSCAMAVLEEFQDMVFSYGVSDEYSFVLRKNSYLYQRRASEIVSSVVSFFTSMYVMRWKDFFQEKVLKYPPSFDGRAVCYPSSEILRDYLSWRQVDCHINNQYNSCFWKLVTSGKNKREAQHEMKGAQLQKKLEELGIEYDKILAMFRHGSSIFWDKEDSIVEHHQNGNLSDSHMKKIMLENCDIIGPKFWLEHSSILDEKQ